MKIAKMDKGDFDAVCEFRKACELVLERGKFSMNCPEEEWLDLDDDDEDKIEMLRIRSRIAIDEEIEDSKVDNRIICYEFLKSKLTHRFILLIITAEALIDSCCDPTVDTLEFHPSLRQLHVAEEQ